MAGTASIYWISQTSSACPFPVSFVVTTNWTESPTGTWIPISGHNGEGLGLDTIAGDGYIQADYDGTVDTYNTAIFLTTSESPTAPYYENVEYGLYIADGSYTTAINGVYEDRAIAVASGDKFRVWRSGTTIKAQYYRSSTWNDIFTYTTGSTGMLWMGASSADPGWAVKCVNPKYCN